MLPNSVAKVFWLPSCSLLYLHVSVKRARDDHTAGGSGTEPHKKKQKDERKTEQDCSSPSSSFDRSKITFQSALPQPKEAIALILRATFLACVEAGSLQCSTWLQLPCLLGSVWIWYDHCSVAVCSCSVAICLPYESHRLVHLGALFILLPLNVDLLLSIAVCQNHLWWTD